MAVLEGGTSAVLVESAAASAKGLHIIPKPVDTGALGLYALASESGTVAAGAGANINIFAARWSDSTRLALIEVIGISMFRDITTGFAAGTWNFKLFVTRSYTVSDATNGTSVLPATNSQKMRTSMGTTLFNSIHILNTAAAGLTGGTGTDDTSPHSTIYGRTPVTVGANLIPPTQLADSAAGPGIPLWPNPMGAEVAEAQYPIVLAANEGIRVKATVPATGTWNVGVFMKWAEVTAY